MNAALHILWLILVLGFSAFGLFVLISIALHSRARPEDREDQRRDNEKGNYD